jgi:hypothetical protein
MVIRGCDPSRGCVLFIWAPDTGVSSKDALTLLFRRAVERLVAVGIKPSDIGPGKGCPVAFGVPSPEGEVTVIGGDEAGQLWVATWGASDETSPSAQRAVPHTLAAVRSAIAEALDAEARASEARWMTFREWAALEKSGPPPAGGRP